MARNKDLLPGDYWLERQLMNDPEYERFYGKTIDPRRDTFNFEDAKSAYLKEINSDPKYLTAIKTINTAFNDEEFYNTLGKKAKKSLDKWDGDRDFNSVSTYAQDTFLKDFMQKYSRDIGITNYNSVNDENQVYFDQEQNLEDYYNLNSINEEKDKEDEDDKDDDEEDFDPTIVETPDTVSEYWEDVVRNPDYEYYGLAPYNARNRTKKQDIFKNKYQADLTDGLNIREDKKLNLSNAMYQATLGEDRPKDDDDPKKKYFDF